MATDVRCPVCSEAFADRPARCYRCETSLGSWWRFEDEMQGLLAERATPPARGAFMLVVGLALTTLALVTTLLTRPRAIPEPPHTALPAAPSRAPAAVAARAGSPAPLRYTVQRGDSPWRIAAALTGDGRRWRELWASPAPTLHPGMVLELFAPRDAEGSSR